MGFAHQDKRKSDGLLSASIGDLLLGWMQLFLGFSEFTLTFLNLIRIGGADC